MKGIYWNGQNSRPQPVDVYFGEGALNVQFENSGHTANYAEYKISERIANIPRYFNFPDGAQIEVMDNEAVDQMLENHDLSFKLETEKQTIVLATLFVVIVSALILVVGLPRLTDVLAPQVPVSLLSRVSEPVIATLDEEVFGESQLSEEEQEKITDAFVQLQLQESEFTYRLLFRDGGKIGANAFALPDGTVVLTDQLYDLADNYEQIYAVLAHEIGHVEHRHTVKSVIKQAGVASLFAGLFGDVSFISDLVIAAPMMMTQMANSRQMEEEADSYSHEVMAYHKFSPEHFANIMEKLDESSLDESENWASFFSSHPATSERVEKARQLAKQVRLEN